MRGRSRMPPNGSNITAGIGKRASIGWIRISTNCRRRRTQMDARTSIAADAPGSTERELVITRIFDAPRRLVFKAWTEPERAARWWGPQGFVTLRCDMDVRPGGTFRASMRSPEGTVHCRRGVYPEVVQPERPGICFGSGEGRG